MGELWENVNYRARKFSLIKARREARHALDYEQQIIVPEDYECAVRDQVRTVIRNNKGLKSIIFCTHTHTLTLGTYANEYSYFCGRKYVNWTHLNTATSLLFSWYTGLYTHTGCWKLFHNWLHFNYTSSSLPSVQEIVLVCALLWFWCKNLFLVWKKSFD
jgi:hypothetical protein